MPRRNGKEPSIAVVDPPVNASPRARHKLEAVPRFVVLATAAVVFAAAVVVADTAANAGEIRQGVRVAGVDLGGLEPAEARTRLTAAAADLERQPLTVGAEGATRTLPRGDTGVRLDVEATVQAALKVGRSGLVDPARVRAYTGGVDLTWSTTVAQPALAALRDELGKQVGRAAREPSLRLNGLSPVIVPGTAGRAIDPAASERILRAAVGDPRVTTASLPVTDAQPTVSPAAAKAASDTVAGLLSGPVAVTVEDRQTTLAPDVLARAVRAEPVAGKLQVKLEPGVLDKLLRERVRFAYTKPVDADFKISGKKVRVVPAQPGRRVDPVKAGAALLTAGSQQGPKRLAVLPVATSQPELTTAEASKLGIKEQVVTYTTEFSAADGPRVHNISLIGAAIDDKIVKPGEVFSMNAATGERTAAKGYRTAHVLMNGEVVDGLGGGVCQAGTTFFNAVFFGGFEVVQRTNHSLHLSQYPLGRDGTLNWPDKDVKFRNDTDHAILIRAKVTPASMTVSLYSTPVGNKVTFSTSGKSNWRSPPTKYVDDPTMEAGTERVTAGGSAGFDVTVHRTVKRNGKVVHDDDFVSNYRAWTRVVKRGTKPKAPADKPADKPAGKPAPKPKPSPPLVPLAG
jgi:vancomycin resistance protein YoaR